MRRVHGEAMECVMFIGRQRNAWEPIGLDGTGDGKRGLAYRRTEETDGVLLIERGFAYRKTEETDLLRLKRGSC